MKLPARRTERIRISPDVDAAIRKSAPVVAFEWPKEEASTRKIHIARELEAAIVEGGAIPAPIVVVDEQVRIGLSSAQIDELIRSGRPKKFQATDLHTLSSFDGFAAPTAGATHMLASKVGIGTVAVGAIGGVHRLPKELLDVSSDIFLFSRYSGCVVCSGVKPFLDIPNTLEMLEALCVSLVGWQTNYLPTYWSSPGSIRLRSRSDNLAELARCASTQDLLGSGSALLVANPVPKGAEIANSILAPLIEEVEREVSESQALGRDLTPRIVARLEDSLGGVLRKASRALLLSNATLAAQLAVARCLPSGSTA
jgi:pseudouridine-5'-phosphate glycosidase|tara:strand:+ start:16580 stop:17515 length:936 start_codon:yes stop_codon:yes gene_type:complete